MSQYGDHQETLKSALKKYPLTPTIVVDVFYDTITNQDLDGEMIIGILKSGLGISEHADKVINEYIESTERAYC